MKRPARIAISTATGIGMFFFAKGITESAPSYEQVNKPVIACANQLGSTAVTAESVPKHCIDGDFKSVEHITRTYVPGAGYDEKTTSIVYSLPSREAYMKDNYLSQKDYDGNQRVIGNVSIGFSALFGLLMYRTTRGIRVEEQSEEDKQQ